MIIDTIVLFFNAFGIHLIFVFLIIRLILLHYLKPKKLNSRSKSKLSWYFMSSTSRNKYISQNEYNRFLNNQKTLKFLSILYYCSIILTVVIKFLLYKLN